MANPELPAVVPCDGKTTEYDCKASGSGHRRTRDAALTAARAEADARLETMVQCAEPCGEPVVVEVEPPWDCSRPKYERKGRGFDCTLDRCRSVKVTCKQG